LARRFVPDGRRRHALETAARAMFRDDFAGRILRFDSDASDAYAEILACRRRTGRPVATVDAMIAAIARLRGAGVVTRNVADFAGRGLSVVDPWAA
jgi:toxin FitB